MFDSADAKDRVVGRRQRKRPAFNPTQASLRHPSQAPVQAQDDNQILLPLPVPVAADLGTGATRRTNQSIQRQLKNTS